MEHIAPGATLATAPAPAATAAPAAAAAPAAPDKPSHFCHTLFNRGQRVRVQGIVSRPEINGTLATIDRWVQARGRYRVHLDADPAGKYLALKPENVTKPAAVKDNDPFNDDLYIDIDIKNKIKTWLNK